MNTNFDFKLYISLAVILNNLLDLLTNAVLDKNMNVSILKSSCFCVENDTFYMYTCHLHIYQESAN